MGSLAAAAPATAASPRLASVQLPLAAAKKTPVTNATFGAAPSSPHGADGRQFFTFDVTPGGRVSDHISVINYSTKPEKLSIYSVDAVPASDGTVSFASPTATPKQAGAWAAVGTPKGAGSITLKPRSSAVLPVHVVVPLNAPPGDHLGAIVVSLNGLVEGQFGHGSSQKLNFAQRIAIRTLFRVSGPTHPNLQIQHLKASYSGPIDPFAKGTATVNYDVHNAGNVVLGGPQHVTVHGLFGESVVAASAPSLPPLLPGATYHVKVKVPMVYPELLMSAKVAITEQGLQGDVDPGLHTVTSSVHFLAIPWILLLVLLLLILGFALSYWRRRRRRQKARPVGRHRDNPEPQGAQT